MEKRGKKLVKIMPSEYPTLRECIIASFEANGPMDNEELYSTLPHFRKTDVKKIAATLPDEVTGKG